MKTTITLFMFMLLTITVAWGQTIVASGSCGPNATWTLDDQGLFVISGSGVVNKSFPYDDKDDIKEVIISEGITKIDDQLFISCLSLSKVSFPTTLERIHFMCFYNTALEEVRSEERRVGKECRL